MVGNGNNSFSSSTRLRSATARRRRRSAEMVEEEPLTADEIQIYRTTLLKLRRDLLGDMDHMNSEALHSDRQESSGELSSMPIHMADVGTDNYEQEFTLNLLEGDRKALREIDLALDKIEKGEYGKCEGTGRQINRARLNAVPSARYCIEYARKLEQGLIKPDDDDNQDTAQDDDQNDDQNDDE